MHNLTKPFKILVISKNPQNRTELRTHLQIAHFDVITAQNEAEAIKLALAIQVDLALVDLEKEDFDSQGLLELFRNPPASRHIPLLFLGETRFNPRGGWEEDCVDFIQRPLSIEKLKDKIRNLLSLQGEHQRIQERIRQFESHFAFKFAQDIRFPVSIISGFAQLMHQNNDPREPNNHMRYLGQIVKQADLLQERVEDLTYLLQVGHLVEEIDLMEIVHAAVERFKTILEEKSQQILFNMDRQEKVLLRGRRGDLQMALRHLLSNASKFTPRGGTITVGMKKDSRWVHLEVSDTGMGLSGSQKVRLSRWIRQGQDMTPTGVEVGLGLMIIKSVVERHHGKFGFESRLGCGSRFWVDFPSFSHIPFFPHSTIHNPSVP